MSEDEIIKMQGRIIESLVEAVREIALLSPIDAVDDPSWAIIRARKAWEESRNSIYSPSPTPPKP